jgi:hypothetical protein
MKGSLIALAAVMILAACGGAPPAPLTLEEIPAAFQKEFAKAKDETRMVIEGVSRQIERKQLGPAAFQLQNMLEDRSLTKVQSELIARALISVNQKLNEQIEMQEAAVAATPSAAAPNSPRHPTPQLPSENQADPQEAAAARLQREIYRQTK